MSVFLILRCVCFGDPTSPGRVGNIGRVTSHTKFRSSGAHTGLVASLWRLKATGALSRSRDTLGNRILQIGVCGMGCFSCVIHNLQSRYRCQRSFHERRTMVGLQDRCVFKK